MLNLDVPLYGFVNIIYAVLELLPLLHGQHDALLTWLQFAIIVVELSDINVPLAFELRQLNKAVFTQIPTVILFTVSLHRFARFWFDIGFRLLNRSLLTVSIVK